MHGLARALRGGRRGTGPRVLPFPAGYSRAVGPGAAAAVAASGPRAAAPAAARRAARGHLVREWRTAGCALGRRLHAPPLRRVAPSHVAADSGAPARPP